MPRLAHELQEEDLTVETPNVCELMDKFYELYLAMANDPALEDLAGDVAEVIIGLDERRSLAMMVAAEEGQGVQSKSLH